MDTFYKASYLIHNSIVILIIFMNYNIFIVRNWRYNCKSIIYYFESYDSVNCTHQILVSTVRLKRKLLFYKELHPKEFVL